MNVERSVINDELNDIVEQIEAIDKPSRLEANLVIYKLYEVMRKISDWSEND